MGRPKSDNEVQPNYDKICQYLVAGKYPDSTIGESGNKANFRRMCSRCAVVDGILH